MKKVNWKNLLKKIPNRVQVDSKTFYEVLWIDDFVDKKTLGETRHDIKQVVLKKNLSPKETIATYLHEIAHVYSDVYKFTMTENQITTFELCLPFLLKNDNIFIGSVNHEKRRVKKKVSGNRKKTKKNAKRK